MTLSLLGLFVPLVIATSYNTWNNIEQNYTSGAINPVTMTTINGQAYQYNRYHSLSGNLFSTRYLFSTGFYGSTRNYDNLKNTSYDLPYIFMFQPLFDNEKALSRCNAYIFPNSALTDYYEMHDMITNTLIFSENSFLIRTDFSNFAIKAKTYQNFIPRDNISLYLSSKILYYKNGQPINYNYTYQLDLKTENREDGTYLVPDYVDDSPTINYPYFYTYGSTYTDLVINAFTFECGFMINNMAIYDVGYNVGYATGLTRGYQQGLDDLQEKDASYSTPLNVIKKMFESMTSLLNIQIFPNFTIGTFVSLPLIAGAFYLILRLLKG